MKSMRMLPKFILCSLITIFQTYSAQADVALKDIECCDPKCFDKDNFCRSTWINNRFYRLKPGTQFTFEGTVEGEEHQVVFTVTDLVKIINGIPCVVVLDKDFTEGELVERELAFQAQDKEGNVWNLGEYPEEFEDGKFIGAPNTWITCVDGARAGILVPGKPEIGECFLQGFAPNIDFLDCAQVSNKGQEVCIPFGCFSNVLTIDERSPLEPDSGIQRKYYAPKVGLIQIQAIGEEEPENLQLVKIEHLNIDERKAANQEAQRLDRRAYRVSKVYRHTIPAFYSKIRL